MTGVKFINNTEENLRIAVFKQPYQTPSLQVIAWKIIPLPRDGGNKTLQFNNEYAVYINYPNEEDERGDPYGGTQTAPIPIDQTTANFLVRNEQTNDAQSTVAVLKRVYINLAPSEIHIANMAAFGVWGHITLDENDIYPPQIISPGRTLMENIESPLFVSVIDDFDVSGTVVKVRELKTIPVIVELGDVISITGSKWTGYSMAK